MRPGIPPARLPAVDAPGPDASPPRWPFRGQYMTGAPRASRGRGRPKKADAAAAVAGGSLLQDDMHFADLLDGTVMPTVGNEPVAPSTNMSAQTDSIISLPPLTGAATRWKNLAPPVVPRQRHARHSSLGGPELKTMVAARRPPGSPVGGTIPRKLAAPAPSPLATAAPRRADRDPLVPHDVRIDLEPGVLRHGHSRRPSTEIKPALRAAHSRRPSGEIEPRFDVPGYGAIEGSNRNAHAYLALRREDDEMSAGGSSANGSLRDRRRNRLSRRKRGFPLTDDQETAWNWRFPGAEDALMPSMAWIYLPLIGWLIFVTALTVTGLEDVLLEWVIDPIEGVVAEVWGVGAGKIALALLRAMLLILSFGVVYYFAPLHGAGSGIPEMKCVLTGVFMPNVLSPSTLFAKVVGLVLAAASSISVGKLGPFMHIDRKSVV